MLVVVMIGAVMVMAVGTSWRSIVSRLAPEQAACKIVAAGAGRLTATDSGRGFTRAR